mgnify:CR=1 FL=1
MRNPSLEAFEAEFKQRQEDLHAADVTGRWRDFDAIMGLKGFGRRVLRVGVLYWEDFKLYRR